MATGAPVCVCPGSGDEGRFGGRRPRSIASCERLYSEKIDRQQRKGPGPPNVECILWCVRLCSAGASLGRADPELVKLMPRYCCRQRLVLLVWKLKEPIH